MWRNGKKWQRVDSLKSILSTSKGPSKVSQRIQIPTKDSTIIGLGTRQSWCGVNKLEKDFSDLNSLQSTECLGVEFDQ
jgi:hypothetical protein